ncbi:hypothetical protein ACFX1X_044119 [Malus domestica]
MFGSGGSEVRTPIFFGENYKFWRIKMVTIFKSLGLWNLVEKGITTLDSKKKKKVERSSEDEVDEEMLNVLMKAQRLWELYKTQSLTRSSLELPTLIQLRWHGICCMENTTVVIKLDQ